MKMLDVFRSILREVLAVDMEVEDVLMRAVVLHTHAIALRRDIALEDVSESERSDGRLVLAPLTRRHVAALVAEFWPADPHRGREAFWLDRYERDCPYELFSDVPRERSARAIAARGDIAKHAFVEELLPE
jgi:hypothetical protein